VCYYIETFSEVVDVRSVNIYRTCREVVQEYIHRLSATEDGNEAIKVFTQHTIANLGTVRWTPQLEFCVFCIFQGNPVLSLEAYALLETKVGKPPELWRRGIDTSTISKFTNQICTFREPRTTLPPVTEISQTRVLGEKMYVQSVDKTWRTLSSSGKCTPVIAPSELFHLSVFCAVPGTLYILAIQENSVLVVNTMQTVLGSFAHTLTNPDFLDCFRLSSGTLIVRIGKRNILTGGLNEEELFSFRCKYKASEETDEAEADGLETHELQEDEEKEVEEICRMNYSSHQYNSLLTGWNDLETGTSWCIDSSSSTQQSLGKDLVVAVCGTQSQYVVVFVNGRVEWIRDGKKVQLQLDFPILNALPCYSF
jgi:hypothetical protein